MREQGGKFLTPINTKGAVYINQDSKDNDGHAVLVLKASDFVNTSFVDYSNRYESIDYSWYDSDKDSFEISTAKQLLGLAYISHAPLSVGQISETELMKKTLSLPPI